MQLFVKLTLLALVAAGIMGTGVGFLVKFIVEANQTPHERITGPPMMRVVNEASDVTHSSLIGARYSTVTDLARFLG